MIKKVSRIDRYITRKRKIVNSYLKKIINDEIPQHLQNNHLGENHTLDLLSNSSQYTLLAEGKRFRPILAITVYELFRNDASEEILTTACALELIHTASLMLDDLPSMDNARYRRGKKAHHRLYGKATTILSAAALLALSFKILTNISSVKINPIVKDIAEAIGHRGLAGGQFCDLKLTKQTCTIKELAFSYKLKTGMLFKSAAKIGAILGGSSRLQEKILAKFGENFGLAFQVRDDILGYEADLAKLGKDAKIDNRNAKPTYVSLLGKKRAKKKLVKIIDSSIAGLDKLNLKVDRLTGLAEYLKVD